MITASRNEKCISHNAYLFKPAKVEYNESNEDDDDDLISENIDNQSVKIQIFSKVMQIKPEVTIRENADHCNATSNTIDY